MNVYSYEFSAKMHVSLSLEEIKGIAEVTRSVHPSENPEWQEEDGEFCLYVRERFSPLARISVYEVELLYFIQTAVDGEGPHAEEVMFDDFIDACRRRPNAPVETDNHRTYLRLDVEAPE